MILSTLGVSLSRSLSLFLLISYRYLVFDVGEPADRFYMILRGKVGIVVRRDATREHEISRFSGDSFGEISILAASITSRRIKKSKSISIIHPKYCTLVTLLFYLYGLSPCASLILNVYYLCWLFFTTAINYFSGRVIGWSAFTLGRREP